MELLNEFGFNPTLFVAQIINFLILAFLFKKLLYKPILKMIKDRQTKIERGLKDAKDAQLAKEQAENEKNKILQKASHEAQVILDDTKNMAETVREEILEKTRVDAEKIIENAKTQANIEIEEMKREAKNISLEMSRHILDSLSGKLFTKEEKNKVVKRALERIDKI